MILLLVMAALLTSAPSPPIPEPPAQRIIEKLEFEAIESRKRQKRAEWWRGVRPNRQ